MSERLQTSSTVVVGSQVRGEVRKKESVESDEEDAKWSGDVVREGTIRDMGRERPGQLPRELRAVWLEDVKMVPMMNS